MMNESHFKPQRTLKFTPQKVWGLEFKMENRTKSGYTQEDISKKIGVSRQTINSIENNRFHPSILLCLKLSKEWDCRLDDLFFLES